VLLTVPAVRHLVGPDRSAIAIAAVALSLAATPALAAAGRTAAGNLRRQRVLEHDRERTPLATADVLVVGMGRRGRTIADALEEFDIDYAAVERDPRRLKEAVADGYRVVFGNMADSRIWTSIGAKERKFSLLTGPQFEDVESVGDYARTPHPPLRRVAAVGDEEEAALFRGLGIEAVIDRSSPPGVDIAAWVLREMGVPETKIGEWRLRTLQQAQATPEELLEVA
jgi:hypothetical protein